MSNDPETTYERYQRVLEEIADGADNPKALAEAALRPHKRAPTYQWKIKAESRKKHAQEARDKRSAEAKQAYLDWLKAGHPSISKYAKLHGKTRSSMLRLLERGERAMQMPWREQRLSWSYRNKNYDKAGDVWRAKYGEEPPR